MRTLCWFVLLGLGASALGQEAAAQQGSSELEELIVSGRRPENLRLEIERLENAVYERFNALNSSNEFDVHCFEQPPTGSNIPVRTCAPNFVTRTESRAGETMVRDGRDKAGNNNNPAEQRMNIERKNREFVEEIQRVARADEQLLRGLARLDELKQLQTSETERRRRER
jgi:hypothetical protein